MGERRTGRMIDRESRKTSRGSFSRGKRRRRAHRFRSEINWKRFGLLIVLAAIFLYGTVNLVRYALRSADTRRTNAELAAMHAQAAAESPQPTPEPTSAVAAPQPAATPQPELSGTYQYIGEALLPGMDELYAINPDLVAWMSIPGIVELPVVYRDNTYYLDHDFYWNQSDSGALFLDEAHPLLSDTQYLVVHGHAMYDGSMFGLITHYRHKSYADEHPIVYLDTLYRKETYEVICALQLPTDVSSDGYVAYSGTRKFRDAEHFNVFIDSIRDNALYWIEGAELLPSDALLALSTCYEDERIVVMCRRVDAQD